ncbi:MAG: DUF805 domain-containing protein [Opitutaceae bacterium]|nr:DUF805 domain-containing protein [Opitutaceae bacterium]
MKHYIDFGGRSCRREALWFVLFNIIFAGAALGLDNLCGWTFGWPPCGPAYIAYCIFALCPSLALQVRRLHDTGHSGWMLLVALIPIAGPIWLLVLLLFARGDLGENRYGPPPSVTGLPLRMLFYYSCSALSLLLFAGMTVGALGGTLEERESFWSALLMVPALAGLSGGWLLLRRNKKGLRLSLAGVVLIPPAFYFMMKGRGLADAEAAAVFLLIMALPLLFAWLSFPRAKEYGPLPSLLPAKWAAIPLRTRFYYISDGLLLLLFALMTVVFLANILDGDPNSGWYALGMVAGLAGTAGAWLLLKRRGKGILPALAGGGIMVFVFSMSGNFVREGLEGRRYVQADTIIIMALVAFLLLCTGLLFPRPRKK